MQAEKLWPSRRHSLQLSTTPGLGRGHTHYLLFTLEGNWSGNWVAGRGCCPGGPSGRDLLAS